jgi:hypothetical protein
MGLSFRDLPRVDSIGRMQIDDGIKHHPRSGWNPGERPTQWEFRIVEDRQEILALATKARVPLPGQEQAWYTLPRVGKERRGRVAMGRIGMTKRRLCSNKPR